MKILIIEDEPELLNSMISSLKEESFVVESASDFFSASEKLGIYDYDCILLDISLPGGNGLKLLQQLKSEDKQGGVIIVSAKGSIDDKVNKTALAEHVWGDYIDEVNSFDFIYSQIKNLRRKLKQHNAEIEINAIYGVGYKLTDS